MKRYLNGIVWALLVAAAIPGCKKDENRVIFEGGTPPVLTASVTGTIPLEFAKKDAPALQLSWTNPDYKFNTGVSSQDVNYLIDIDTTGANFTNPARQTVAVSKDLSRTFTHGEFNDYLLNQLALKPGMPHSLEIRVKSALGSTGAVPLTSNVLQFTVTPYVIPPKITPPASGNLYIVGSATPGGWNNPVPEPSQVFTKISETLYEIAIPLSAGGSYLLLPVNGSWDVKYGGMGSNNSNKADGDDFKQGGGDLLAPAESGPYKISVDFQRGKFTVTKQ